MTMTLLILIASFAILVSLAAYIPFALYIRHHQRKIEAKQKKIEQDLSDLRTWADGEMSDLRREIDEGNWMTWVRGYQAGKQRQIVKASKPTPELEPISDTVGFELSSYTLGDYARDRASGTEVLIDCATGEMTRTFPTPHAPRGDENV